MERFKDFCCAAFELMISFCFLELRLFNPVVFAASEEPRLGLDTTQEL